MPVSLPLFLVLFTWVLLSIALGLKFYEWSRKREMSAMLRTAAEDPVLRRQPVAAGYGRQTAATGGLAGAPVAAGQDQEADPASRRELDARRIAADDGRRRRGRAVLRP